MLRDAMRCGITYIQPSTHQEAMRWLRTMVLFDKGNVMNEPGWDALHSSYVRSIQAIENPRGTGSFTIRERTPIPRQGREQQKFERNGVVSIKKQFYDHLTTVEGWQKEEGLDFGQGREDLEVPLTLYPSREPYREPLGTNFGPFDFATVGPGGIKTVIEWETGNVSSSHRSINKLCVCLNAGIVAAGVVIVPSRPLYRHLTDRIGNIDELSGYLSLWQSMEARVARGLLAITVVEHDALTTDLNFPLLDRGNDGRAEEGRRRLLDPE